MSRRVEKSPQQQRRADWLTAFRKAKRIVRVRSGGRCEYSGAPCTNAAAETHHRLDRSHPRTNEPEFLLDLCSEHHRTVHAYPEISYAEGWLLSFDSVPKEVSG